MLCSGISKKINVMYMGLLTLLQSENLSSRTGFEKNHCYLCEHSVQFDRIASTHRQNEEIFRIGVNENT